MRPFYLALLVPALLFGCVSSSPAEAKGAANTLSAQTASAGGSFMFIGGGKDQDVIMRRLSQLAGGPDAPIVIVPFASSTPAKSGQAYVDHLAGLGHHRASVLLPGAAATQGELERIRSARGFFFSGGDQTRILKGLDAPWRAAFQEAFRRGAVMAGTSAGAMVWGAQAILEGEPMATAWYGDSPAQPGIRLGPAFAIAPGLIVDTHFSERGRLPRLAYAVASAKGAVGLGVDPQTAAVLHADGRLEVIGNGTVTLLKVPAQPLRAPLSLRDMRLSILAPGDAARIDEKP